MKNRDLLILVGGIVALAVIMIVVFLAPRQAQPEKIDVVTDKTEYKIGDALKVKIENNFKENICFSSCYPYYFERKDGVWKSYHYVSCPTSDLVEICINPKQIKAFKLTIPSIETGPHRLAAPACIGCSLQEAFKEDKWIYSDEFIVK